MDLFLSNATDNSSMKMHCVCTPKQTLFISLVNTFTFIFGQLVILRLLWFIFMSNKAVDILYANLGVFHYFQYWLSFLQLVFSLKAPHHQVIVMRFLFIYAQTGGPMSLVFISFQRYVAVIHPSSYPLLKKYRYSEICVSTMWVICMTISVGSITNGGGFSLKKVEVFKYVSFVLMVVKILVIGRCSIRITRMLMKTGPGGGKMNPAKKRAFKTIIATTTICLMFYIPVTLLQRFLVLGECGENCIVIPRCVFLMSAASVVHPLFYLATHEKLPCLKRKV